MLIQRRPDEALRLFAQHDHALICGDMARAWRGPGDEIERLPFETILAIGLHDYAWVTDDRYALRDRTNGRPLDFIAYPMPRRLSIYTDGIDALERLHPYAAVLVSLHYCTFQGMSSQRVFVADETARRERLATDLTPAQHDPKRQKRDLALLKLFDILSLYVCMAPPPADRSWLPSWLDPDAFATYPDGTRFELEWEGDHRLSLSPSPWEATFEVTLPYRQLDASAFRSQDALDEAFTNASRGAVVVSFSK